MQKRKNLQKIKDDQLQKVLEEVKYPIPVTLEGKSSLRGIEDALKIVHLSGDDKAIWVADRESARLLVSRGHAIITDSTVLRNQAAYLQNPVFKQKYPFWYE